MSKPVCEHYENPCCRKPYESEPSHYKKSSCCESSCCESNFFQKPSHCGFDCCRPNCCCGTFISPLTSLLVGPGPIPNGG